jgi:hypothetical protein
MNGKQCKSLRKALELKKPTPATESGLILKQENGEDRLYFQQRKNPSMNLYRTMKRRYKRGW